MATNEDDLQPVEEVEEVVEEQPLPKLLAGKYKTPEELEHAYEEAQKTLTRQGQTLGTIKKQAQELGAYVDDDGNIVVPKQTTEPAAANTTDYAEEFNTQFWENPLQMSQQLMQTARQQQKLADANLEAVIAEYEDDPLYSKVARKFKSELTKLDDAVLANTPSARQAAAFIFDSVVGKFTREQATKLKANPTERKSILAQLGIEEPEPSAKDDSDTLTRRDEQMLKEMGLDDKTVKDATEAARKTGGGTRERY